MKISLNWLKDYITLPTDIPLSKIAYDLTMSTVEVEDTVELSKSFDKIVVGIVNEVLPHPDADKLRVCVTDIGGEIKEIVCGGINLTAGMKVAVSLPGAMVRWHGEGDLVEVKIAKVRGVESFGMICASSEIGLFDLFPYKDEATILDLSAFDAAAGTPLADALGLDDVILEIDNKSLTNRPDLWGHYGIAREISALYDLPMKEIAPYSPPSSAGFSVNIDDRARCTRYVGVEIDGVSVTAAPFEIQSRLWRVGLRPINALVDITNYVMLCTGQPTHAFDADKIKGSITVRPARDGEKLLLLDDRELTLTPGDLVIADDEGAVGLAGVMGGKRDSVLPETNKVILEIANFEPRGIRRTATRHDARTESSMRFEKGLDAERVDATLSLAMGMFGELFAGMKVTGFCDNRTDAAAPPVIDVSLSWLAKRLGKRLADDEIRRILSRLGFGLEFAGDSVKVSVPSWRATGDISIPEDIMEEIARMYGYENFETLPITTSFEGAINQPAIDIDRKLREYLAFKCGMREIMTYPWVKDDYAEAVLGGTQGMLSLAAPPAPDEKYLQSSLLPNLCRAVVGNLRYFEEFAVYESAHVFFDRDWASEYDPRESLPKQQRMLAGAFVGKPDGINMLFRQAKGVIAAMSDYLHIEPLEFSQDEKPVWADDVLWLNVTGAGNLALLSKKACMACGIKNAALMIFELNIDALKPLPSRTNKFTRIPEYQMTDYDLSLLFDSAVKWEQIHETAAGKPSAENLLRGVSFVDEYRGKQVPDGKKSITLRLRIGSLTKTLTSDEIENCAKAVTKRLTKTLGAGARDA